MNKILRGEKIMRVLIVLLGAGLGFGLAAIALPYLKQYIKLFADHEFFCLALYWSLAIIGALVFFLFSDGMMKKLTSIVNAIEQYWEAKTPRQTFYSALGIIGGLVVAALLTRLVLAAGTSLLSITISAIIYVMCATVGARYASRLEQRSSKGSHTHRLSWRKNRSGEILDTLNELIPQEDEAPETAETIPAKVLDTSVLIDGRIVDLAKCGFIEGKVLVPRFIIQELQTLADSSEETRRSKGRRGLDFLKTLEDTIPVAVTGENDQETGDADQKLLHFCVTSGLTLLTTDYNLNKAASASGIRVLNLNDLSNALRPILTAGQILTVHIIRAGKEAHQGVAYLPDGTMMVVENARESVGQDAEVMVTSVLQTSAGRMIFARKGSEAQTE